MRKFAKSIKYLERGAGYGVIASKLPISSYVLCVLIVTTPMDGIRCSA